MYYLFNGLLGPALDYRHYVFYVELLGIKYQTVSVI